MTTGAMIRRPIHITAMVEFWLRGAVGNLRSRRGSRNRTDQGARPSGSGTGNGSQF